MLKETFYANSHNKYYPGNETKQPQLKTKENQKTSKKLNPKVKPNCRSTNVGKCTIRSITCTFIKNGHCSGIEHEIIYHNWGDRKLLKNLPKKFYIFPRQESTNKSVFRIRNWSGFSWVWGFGFRTQEGKDEQKIKSQDFILDVLDVLFVGLEASPVAWKPFMKA